MAGEVMDILFRARMDVSDVATGVGQIQRDLKKLELPKDITNNLEKGFNKLTPLIKEYQKLLGKETKTPTDVKNLESIKSKIHEVMGDIKIDINQISSMKIQPKADLSELNKIKKDINSLEKQLSGKMSSLFKGKGLSSDKAQGIINNMGRATSLKGLVADVQLKFNQQDIQGYIKAIDTLENKINSIKTKDTKINIAEALGAKKSDLNNLDTFFTNFFTKLRLNPDTIREVDKLRNNLKELEQIQAGKAFDSFKNGEDIINGIINDFSQLSAKSEQTGADISKAGQSIMSMSEQVGQLQQSTQYFFSLRNMINLLKRGVDDAIQSVKELDAAMTETAVVTDYKVSDLWGMLPQYTQLANQLGATTQGAYETMTLYFQQGLDQQQAFEIGAETMKMARIAGLDYAETTDMMTAALRGFNMELNETSAKRINDVYSELAAITASDTEELGTAMQRTASIAHSAGMSFEGTTAFLAQAIETTREPAENIGTAMKTIVARFQEMKQNPLQISEVDGEEVDYNKVDAALQSIGVSLKDTNGQFRELDQVFLDISSRWDGLSQTQQRYIATVAAGSRQQSRFIAMMDNYDRTMQLFEAANNSAGASDEQFGKTMDSLESKLNKLHNAWQQFTMGIANNSMIKLAVDGMTGLLTITNKLIDAFSLGIGPLKSFLSVFTAFTGLKVAGRAANSLIGGLGGLVDPQSTVKEGLKMGLFGQGKTNAQAQAITTPIVGVLNKISGQIAQIKNSGVNNKGQSGFGVKNTSKQEYANIKAQFDKLSGKEGFKMSDASNLFGQLDAKHQLSMFNNSPGTRTAMKKASMAWLDSKGLSKELTNEGKQYISSIYKGMQKGQIPVDKGVELIGQPQKWGQHFGTETALNYSKSFAKEMSSQAHQEAMQYLVGNPEAYKFQSKEFKDWYNNQANEAQKEAYAKYFKQVREAEEKRGLGQTQGKVSDMGRFANDIGSVADKFTQAGYGITTFGNALSQLGGPLGTIGTAISAFGGAVSTIGASISGATGIINLFTEGLVTAEGTVLVAGSTIAAVAAPLAAAAAAFLLVRAHIKKVKEAGEEVTKTFNDTNKEVEGNISKLKSYQTEFATLSQGVDNNGNNVSLDDSQYQRYLEIVDDIAKINPEIVQGYNAQGHAIIDNNKALDETLKKQQQIKKEALDTYTKQSSLQKLINARNVNSDYKGIRVKGSTPGVYDGSGHGNEGRQTPIGLGSDVFKIADELRLIRTKDDLGKTLKVDDKMLQKYGIESMDALISGEEQAVKNFIKHRDKIQAELTNSGFELSNSLIKGFDKLNEDQKAFDEAIQPVYDNLLASVSKSPFYEELGSEFRSAISLGLKDIASQDLNASEMQSQANSLVQEFDNLTRAGGEYATAMEQVESAQDKFASSLDASEYAKNTQGALTTLNSLLKEYEGNTTAYGQAVTEYLTNQIEKIKNFTEEGSISLTEALNGMTSTISAAEGAYDAFQESTKTDFSTGAQSMKSIFEEVTKETDGVMLHMESFGDGTMWKGARALLGDEFVEKNGENVELVKKELLSLKSELQDGEKGFAAFWENFRKVDDSKIEGFTWNEDGSYDINRDINPDAYKQIAEQMHRSEEYVVSMLNKGRQFVSLDFTNIDDVRKALSTDNGAIAGANTTGGNTDLYVKKDYLQNAMSEAGIVNPSEQIKETEKLLAKGIKVIPNATDITKKDFQSMGIKDLSSLIQKFGDTGQFNRSEIEEYAQKMEGYNAGEFDTLYQDYLDSQEHPELPSINSIDNNVASIASMIAQNHGIADKATKDAYKEDSKLVYGENGKGGDPDSIGEFFAKGQNKFGQNLTADEYKVTKKTLENLAAAEEKRKTFYEAQAKKATQERRTEDADWFNKAAKNTQKKIDYLTENLEEGAKAYKDAKEAEKKEKTDTRPTAEIEKEKKAKAEDKRKENNERYRQQYDSSSGPSGKNLNERKQEQEQQKRLQQQQHEREIHEQQAKNASGPTNFFEDTLKQAYNFGLNNTKEIGEQYVAGIANFAINQTNNAEVAKQAGEKAAEDNNKNYQQGLVIDEKYAAYAGQANSAFNEKVKEGAIKLGTLLKDGWDSLSQAETSIPAQNTSFITKVTSSAQKLGEALKNGWQALQNNTPPEPATQSAPTINQGTSTVASVAQEVVQKVTTQEVGLDETQQKLNTINSTASQGAEMTVSTADTAVQSTLQAIQGLRSAASKGISVKTTASSDGGANQIKNTAAKGADMPIRALDKATPVINKINANAKKPVSKTINISPHFTGSWQHSVYLSATGPGANRYTGQNNKISYHHVPLAGSAARGTKKGRVGPRGQGGLTLTGETGYEIAWLPSEDRSMILGASGPEMIKLPKDAVIYNHDQSKEIMKKRQEILAGSMDSGGPYKSSKPTKKSSKKSSKKSKKKSKKKGKNKKDKKETTPTINTWSIEEAVQFNIDQTLASITEEISLRTKDIEKNLEKIGTTYNDIVGTTQAQISALEQVKQKNQELLASNQRQLADYRAQQQYVSWTDANGESQRTLINIASYLNADGSVNTGMIAALGGNRALQEAVYKEVSSAKNIVDGIRNAQKAIADADQQLADLGKQISETFYQWENELTEVYSLTKRINNETSFTGRFTSQIELELAKLGAGFADTAQSIQNARDVLVRNNATIQAQIKNQQQMVAARQRELQAALSYEDEAAKLDKFRNQTGVDSATKAANIEWASNLLAGAKLGSQYANIFRDIDGSIQYQIDWEKFNRDNEANPYSKADYEAIKQYLDDLDSTVTEFNNAIKDQTDFIEQTYNALKEYQDYISDMEDTLIKGIEEQIEQEKDESKQLSDSITSALSDLLDEVKRRLDERRKQEDNAKTERDISQKQQRLAMLRADTAGGHQVEIAQLEKEIADSQQSYQRTLEDQLLERLQQQADEASEQRERQIALMEASNDIEAATNKELVDMWLRDPESYKEEIKAAWLEAQGYDDKGEAGQLTLLNQFESEFAQLVTAVEESNFKDSFNALTADSNSLVALLNSLTNGELGRQDELSHGLGALTDVTDRNTTSILTEIQKQNSVAMLKAKGAGADALRVVGYSAKDLIGDDLNQPIYDLIELQKAGYKASEIRDAGINDVGRLKGANYTAANLKDAGFTFADLMPHYSPEELKKANYSIADFADNDVEYNTAKTLFGVNALANSGTRYADQANKEIEAERQRKAAEAWAAQQQAAWAAQQAAWAAQQAAARPYGLVTKGTNDSTPNGSIKTKAVQYALNALIGAGLAVDGNFGSKTIAAVKAFQRSRGLTADGKVGPKTAAAFNALGYKTGGLADYTGPAWLDGTPSKPELVLNAQDTKNFIALKDVLSHVMGSTNNINNSYGGNATYEININVDHINSDYDVDKITKRVKENIIKDSSYRNVTQVRNFR